MNQLKLRSGYTIIKSNQVTPIIKNNPGGSYGGLVGSFSPVKNDSRNT
jgi:hypothetical protein